VSRRGLARYGLVLILLLGFVLRAWNLDWDRGSKLQPDERFWSDVAANVQNPDDWSWSEITNPEISPLNPRVYKPNYVYGTLPLWASEAAAGVLMTNNMAWAVSLLDSAGVNVAHDDPGDVPVQDRLRFNTGYDVTIIGRLMSALIDTATIGVVYLIGFQLGDRRTGLLAALLQALTVLHIQYSHFLGSEPWVAFFVAVVVWGSIKLARGGGGWKTRLLTGVALGCAIGSKLSGVAGVAAPIAAALIAAAPDLRLLLAGRAKHGTLERVWRGVEPWVVTALVAVVAYRIVQPYDFRAGVSLQFNERFTSDVEYLSNINQGGNWPWVQPLVGATPLIHPLKQVFLWGMGPGLALAAAFGGFRAMWRFRQGEWFWAIPLAVVGAYFVLVSQQFYAIVRYLQPAYPVMVALAATGLVAAWRWAAALETDKATIRNVVRLLVALSIGATMFWAGAFVNGVYNNDNARLAASDWMIENIDQDAVVSQQAWDDGIPWGQPSNYGRVTLEPFSFGGDAPDRIELLIQGLDQVDYVIETSNKFYDSLPKTPARFPQMTEYYERLFDETLGFELVKKFRNPPSLFGITIDDSWAEEAFTVYDHPEVHIWKKTDDFSVARAWQLLEPDRARVAVNVEPKDGAANAAMLRPAAYETQQAGSSFRDVHPSEASSTVSAVSWFVLIQLASFASANFVVARVGSSVGAAWGLTKIVGLLVLAIPIWLVVSWGWFTMSTRLVWFWLIALGVAGVVAPARRPDRWRQLWRDHRRLIIATEVLFIGVFLAIVALRAANPDLWHPWRGGEKPMELAYFTAVTGSTTLPPYDPWLAGGSLNYYYLGWFLLAVPTRILGIQPDIAFNLGVATYAAIAAVTVFSLAALLADLANRRSERSATVQLPLVKTGALATLMFLIMGNLDAFRQVVTRLRNDLPLGDFDWWDPSRVNKNGPGLEVTEFPAFTVLFADLHPHFMAMGVFGLGLALCVGLLDRLRAGRRSEALILAALLGAVSGIVRMVHTWDLPTIVVAAGGAVVFGSIAARGPGWWRARAATGYLAVIAVAHLFVTAPYRASNQVADSGFNRNEWTTNLDDWIAHWGVFLFIAISYLATRLWQHRARFAASSTRPAALVVGLAGFAALHVGVGSVAAWAWLGLVAAIVVVWGELASTNVSTGHVMAAACWTLGFAVLLAVELFTQNADIQRLNTVFKFWLQVWHLFAVAGAFGAMWVLAALRQRHDAHAKTWADSGQQNMSPSPVLRRVFAGGLAMLLVASLLYPVLSVAPRSSNRFSTAYGPSLEGHLWLEPGVTRLGVRDAFGQDYEIDPGLDRPVIEWLRANVDGRPTIVEAVGGAEYQWWGRISITTGLPTVVGWRWHQSQQRHLFNGKVNERKDDVAAFYTAGSHADIDRFLRTYDVSYVVVGSLEAAVASPATLALFDQNVALVPVFRQGPTVVYEVAKRSLAQSSGPIEAIGAG